MSKKGKKKDAGPLVVSIKKLQINYEVRYNYNSLLNAFINSLPSEHRKVRVDNVVMPDGSSKEDWVRIIRDVQIGNLVVFLIDNGIEFKLENLTESELKEIKREYHERQERIRRALKLKEESLDVTNEDYSFMKLPPYEYQKRAVKFFEINNGVSILGDEMGIGKQQPLYSKIATPTGWKTMGDMSVGEVVFGRDGKPHKVVGVFPQGIQPSYKVTFNDGSFTECGLDHLWTVRDSNRRLRGGGWTVKTLRELMEKGLLYAQRQELKNLGRLPAPKWQIPIANACEYDEQEFIIPPYILGALIGDGYICGNSVTISIPDFQLEIREQVDSLLPESMQTTANRYPSCPQYHITQKGGGGPHKTNKFKDEIVALNLNVKSGNKFIPEKYKISSVEQRMELLKGLMDTDGSALNNRVHYHTTSSQLANDVVELVQSLGGQAHINVYDREKEGKPTEHKVNVKMNVCPFNLEAKKKQWWVAQRNYATKYIIDATYVGDTEQQCISVDSPDSTYLTDGHIVTHNTNSAITYATKHSKKTLVICPASLKLMWKDEVSKFTKNNAHVFRYSPSKNSKEKNHPKEESLFHVINYEGLSAFIKLEYKHVCEGNRMDPKTNSFKRCSTEVINLTKKMGTPCPACGGAKFKSRIHGTQFFKTNEGEVLDPDDYDLIVIDEFHRMKNHQTDWTQIIKRSLSVIPEKLLLSGTAIKSRPIELFVPLNFLDPKTWNDRHAFAIRFCAAFEDKFGWVYDGVSNTEELYNRISPMYLRRLKKDILPELPDKTFTEVRLELDPSQLKEFKKLETATKKLKDEFGQDIVGEEEIPKTFMEKVHQIKLLTETIKLERAAEFIQDIIDAKSKVVLFFDYLPTAQRIKDMFGDKAVIHTGSMSQAEKHAAVTQFQTNKNVNVFGGTIMSAGVGITLTAANKLIFLGQAWTTADMQQSEDRIHRANTVHDNIQIITYLCNETWDMDIYEFLRKKKQVVSKVLDNVDSNVKSTVYEGSMAHMLYRKLMSPS